MLLKIGRFEAKTVLSNQALANEQLSFLCDFSFLFAVHDAGSGEGAVSLSHMVQMLLHGTNPCPWPPQCAPAQGAKAAGESQGLSGGPAHLLGVRKPFLREPPKRGERPFRKSTSSLLKTSWMQLQRDTDTTAEDEGKAPWSRGCSASAMLSVSILDMFGAGAPKRAKQEASSPPRDLPVAGKERGHSGGGHSGVPWVLCCSSGSIQEQMSPLPPLPAVRAAWHHVPQQMI